MPGRLFDLSRHLYLVDLYNDSALVKVIKKAGQMGASEYAISWALWAADVHQATPLYVFPTDEHVSDFSTARLGQAIEASPYLQQIVVNARDRGDGRRGADRVKLKRIRDRFLYFRGGKVTPEGRAPQLKSIDADVLALDEVDEMDPRAPSIAVKRLGHSRLGWQLWISTPSYHDMGIDAKYKESDQRTWMIRCQACGNWQDVTIDDVVTEWDGLKRPVAWHGGPEEAWPACRRCGHRLDRLGAGRWVPAYPDRDVHGYYLNGLHSAHKGTLTLVTNLITTDETKRKEAYNQDLGLPYTPHGGQLDDTILDSCQRDYGPGPVAGEKTVMGVDVGKVLHGVIRGPVQSETGERPQRWSGEIESFDGLALMMKRYDVKSLVIDALPETTKARELQAAFPRGRVWLAYYVTQKVGSKRSEPAQWNRDEGVVNLDRTRTIDMTIARFIDGENTLPANARNLKDYYDHLKALVRVIEDGPGGQKVARYIESGPSHLAHAENYCAVASIEKRWRDVEFLHV